ncbi:MAG: amidohydrolase family protein [Acidimicrobiia bacterium]
MYEKNGEKYFIVDGHIHWWDASPENWKNKYGEGWIRCFYGYHSALSPEEYVWPFEKYCSYSEEDLMKDLFEDGYVDVGVFLPTYLYDFYHEGFNPTARDAILKEKYPDKFVLNTAWDPRDGEAGLEVLEEKATRWNIKGCKLYTAEWRGNSKGWDIRDPWSMRYLEKCQELGINVVHVHKGPTIWPLNKDSFEVDDIDEAATAFPDLTFIIEHCNLPRLEDFCWIAVQETNVWGGLAVVLPFIHTRPRQFAKWLGELLFWVGPDKLTFASDYALWHPKWLIEQFVDFQMPEDMVSEYGELTPEIKRKILGLNLAGLYDLQVPAEVMKSASVTA